MRVVAARSRDGAGGIDRFAVEIVIAVGVGIGFLEDRGAAGDGDGAVVIVDDAAGVAAASAFARAVGDAVVGVVFVIGVREAVAVDLGEAARVARSALEADIGSRAPFGAAVAVGGRRVARIGLAFDGGPLGRSVGFGERAGVYFGTRRVAAVVFGNGIGFAGSIGTKPFPQPIKRQK